MDDTEEPTGERVRVVLVDDHSMVAEGFRRTLEATGAVEVVAVVGTGAGALDAAARWRPDVVVMDYGLPDIDGATAAGRIIREVGSKVLLLTGGTTDAALQAAMAAGCSGYLEKTAGVDKLVAAIRGAAAGDIVLSARDVTRLLVSRQHQADSPLTPREVEILTLLGDGLSNRTIADRLVLSVNTVRTHVQTVLTKLGAHSKLEVVVIARRRGLLPA